MEDNKILIDFEPNDYIVRLSPFLDQSGNWTGELMVGTVTTDDNTLNDHDHYQLMKITQMVCASVPLMEEDDTVRQLLSDVVAETPIVEEPVPEKASKVIEVEENVINVKFS
jgi:hypothetical protein